MFIIGKYLSDEEHLELECRIIAKQLDSNHQITDNADVVGPSLKNPDRSIEPRPRWSHYSDGPGQRGSSNQEQSEHQSIDGMAQEDQNQWVQPEFSVERKPAIQRGAKTRIEANERKKRATRSIFLAWPRFSTIAADQERRSHEILPFIKLYS